METSSLSILASSSGTTVMYAAIAGLSGAVFFIVEIVKKFMPDKLEPEYIPMVAVGVGIVLAVIVGIREHLDIISCILQGAQLGGNALVAASGRGAAEKLADKIKGNDKKPSDGASGKPGGDF